MNGELRIRKARDEDLPFVVECIIQSEYSGTETLSYSKIFNCSEEKVRSVIAQVLNEEITGQPWCMSHFLIGEVDGNACSGFCVFIEGSGSLPSEMIKTQALSFFLGPVFQAATAKLRLVQSFTIPHRIGFLQIDNGYTRPEYRRRGYQERMLEHAIVNHPGLNVEMQCMEHNQKSFYERLGFHCEAEVRIDSEEALEMLPGNCRLQMIRYASGNCHGKI